jgi:ribose/xylose/arabinose/galactoside ABC-type transport system permease subunit
MKKNVFGIFGLLVAVFVITAIADPNFLSAYNMQNTIKWSSLYGVMSIGVAFVIITGGIDLSIGSVVGLVAVVLSFFTKIQGLDPNCGYWAHFTHVCGDWTDSRITNHQSKVATFRCHPLWSFDLSEP